jgi:hypothetical protein
VDKKAASVRDASNGSEGVGGVTESERLTCGIVMPISALEGRTEQHWSDVREILSDAIETAGFSAQLVSDADDIGIIQKRIIRNLYDNAIVVCDVSAKNPNVMFELGMRLAFDKPTIIVKDDATSYSFDTAPIQHLEYPRDLRFQKVVEFKNELVNKIRATHRAATTDPGYTTFLKNFGTFSVAKIEETEVSANEFILEELRDIRLQLSKMTPHRTGLRTLTRKPEEAAEAMPKIIASLQAFASDSGIRGKKAMREKRDQAMNFVQLDIDAPLYFDGPEEFKAAFNAIFDVLY